MNINLANLFVITNPNYVPLKIEIPLTAATSLGRSFDSKQGLKEKEQVK